MRRWHSARTGATDERHPWRCQPVAQEFAVQSGAGAGPAVRQKEAARSGGGMGEEAFQPSEEGKRMTRTTDNKDYADTLARLYAIPATQPQRRETTQAQERARLFEDLLAMDGEATW